MIETHLHLFANLRTAMARNRYPAFTLTGFPNFAFLNGSDKWIVRLIASGFIKADGPPIIYSRVHIVELLDYCFIEMK